MIFILLWTEKILTYIVTTNKDLANLANGVLQS
jgi:hypothetical protein